MDHRALPHEDSTSESLSASSVGYSEMGSLVESVGSAEIESWATKPKLNARTDHSKSRPARTNSKIGTQFKHFVKEIRDIPVEAAWAFLRDHRRLADLVPGIVESFHYLEGQGGIGSVYVTNYSPQYVRPGTDKYLIHKIEFSDHASKLHVVRRVGGQCQTFCHVYMMYVQVLAHDALGDGSSVVVWRLEYESKDSVNPPPKKLLESTKTSYMVAVDMIEKRYLTMNRVHRPIQVRQAVDVSMMKQLKLRLQADKKWLATAADDQEPGVSSQQHKRKSMIMKSDEGSDQESKVKERSRQTRRRLLPM